MRILHLAALLASPLTVMAAIRIMIETDSNNQLKVSHSGSDSARINEQEIRMFHLTQDVLLEAARRFFGGRPIIVYFHDPVGTRNRYQQWGYQDTTCTASVSSTKIGNEARSIGTLVRHELRNDHPTQNVTFSVNMLTEVEATVSSIWENMREINLGKTIEYGVDAAGGSFELSWTSSMGNSTTESTTQIIGQELETTVVVPPNTTRTIEILATRSTVDVVIDYLLELSGVSLTWYRLIRYGRNFWGHSIRSMLAAGHVPTRRFARQHMKVGYHFDAAMNSYDEANNLLESKKMKMTMRPKAKGELNNAYTVKCLPLENR